MRLTTGSSIGPYQIEALLGAGAMGEVYRAHDSRLDRAVAVKLLPALFPTDPERLARFEREARTLASVNHPNIAQVYGLEEAKASAASSWSSWSVPPWRKSSRQDRARFRAQSSLQCSSSSAPAAAGADRRAPDCSGTRRGAREGHRSS